MMRSDNRADASSRGANTMKAERDRRKKENAKETKADIPQKETEEKLLLDELSQLAIGKEKEERQRVETARLQQRERDRAAERARLELIVVENERARYVRDEEICEAGNKSRRKRRRD